MFQKKSLEELYRSHHEKGARYGYLYCGGARSPYLSEWIGKGKRVLDLGCRDGKLTESYLEGNEVTGVDIDRRALQMAQERLGIDTFWLDLNEEWPFAGESFDVIVACEIIEHLFFLDSFLDNVAASLKPEGLFIGSVPNAFRLRNRMKFLKGRPFDGDPTHVRHFSFQILEKKLSENFQDVELVPLAGTILPGVRVSSATPSILGRLFAKDLLWRATRKSALQKKEIRLPVSSCEFSN